MTLENIAKIINDNPDCDIFCLKVIPELEQVGMQIARTLVEKGFNVSVRVDKTLAEKHKSSGAKFAGYEFIMMPSGIPASHRG